MLEIAAPDGPTLPQLSLWDEVVLDFSTQGLSVRAHPVGLLRPLLGPKVVTIAEALDHVPNGKLIEVVGAVTARQQPGTAKGMVFLLMEDETGQLNVIVSPQLYKEQRTTIRGEPMLRMVGRLERHDRVVNLVAREAHRLPRELRERSPRRMKAKNFG